MTSLVLNNWAQFANLDTDVNANMTKAALLTFCPGQVKMKEKDGSTPIHFEIKKKNKASTQYPMYLKYLYQLCHVYCT